MRVWTIEEQNFSSSLADLMALAFSGAERRMARDVAVTANNAKSTFLATMSHEIRTPMNSIMGFAELAMDKATNPQIINYLSKITDSTGWLLRIINDILDISKIESGKLELESVPFGLQDVISRCQSVILTSVKEKGLDMRLYVEPPTGKKLLGDSVRLYQIIMNLLSNAVKFTNKGTVKLISYVKKSSDTHATVYFEVRDTGIGMTTEQVDKVFDMFIQADSSTTRTYGGTGLGLAIVKNIVELMGGKLAVESEPGKGSTFSFEIEFETTDAPDSAPNNISFKTIERPKFNGRILICDDNPINRQVVCEHLARVGLETTIAENGKEGVEMVKAQMQNGEKPFDLILMDIFMPIMDGIEAATAITELNTGIPIVAMTANIMVSEVENYKKHGMPDFLGKPFTSQELWRVLLKYLTPVSSSMMNEEEQARDTDELLNMLRINFARNYQSVYDDIVDAIANNDITLAHRIVHTLKGNAGQIGERELQDAATKVEAELKGMRNAECGMRNISESAMERLKSEFTPVIKKLQPLLASDVSNSAFRIPHSELFTSLNLMLKNINPKAINLLDDLRAIPGTEEVARYIENFDFEPAIRALAELKAKGVFA
jgi:CheY-like chemotaxis protein